MTAEAVYQTFSVEGKSGYELLMNVADAAYHPIGAKVVWNGRTLKVDSEAIVNEQGLAADNARVFCLEVF